MIVAFGSVINLSLSLLTGRLSRQNGPEPRRSLFNDIKPLFASILKDSAPVSAGRQEEGNLSKNARPHSARLQDTAVVLTVYPWSLVSSLAVPQGLHNLQTTENSKSLFCERSVVFQSTYVETLAQQSLYNSITRQSKQTFITVCQVFEII